MGFVAVFIQGELVAALIARYKLALSTPGADVGAARGVIVAQLQQDQADERKELKDYLDFLAGDVGGPRGDCGSNYGKCGRRGRG